jgi:hypothetical protein
MTAVAAADATAEATATAAVAVATEAAAATKGAGATAVDSSLRSVEYLCFFFTKFISYVASYVGPIQTGFLRGFRKSSGGTGIVIPVKKVPQERKLQESGGFLQITNLVWFGRPPSMMYAVSATIFDGGRVIC